MSENRPKWISIEFALSIHDRQIAEHGGSDGVRDRGMLDSALARPRQLHAYGGDQIDLPSLAAAYGYGISRNHAFIDGNKRTAYVVMRTFLVLNGWDLVAPMADRYTAMLRLAAGDLTEDELAAWLRQNSRPDQVTESRAGYG